MIEFIGLNFHALILKCTECGNTKEFRFRLNTKSYVMSNPKLWNDLLPGDLVINEAIHEIYLVITSPTLHKCRLSWIEFDGRDTFNVGANDGGMIKSDFIVIRL